MHEQQLSPVALISVNGEKFSPVTSDNVDKESSDNVDKLVTNDDGGRTRSSKVKIW